VGRRLSRHWPAAGRLDEARELNGRARVAFEELGNRHVLASLLGHEGEVEHQAGNLDAAARLTRESYDALTASGDRSYASTVAAALGVVLLDLNQDDEAWRFGEIAQETSSSDDVISQAGGRAVQARVLSRRGEHDTAESVAREAVEIMARTDYLSQHAETLVHLAQVLHGSGKVGEAVAAAREAAALYDRKGATYWVEQTQQLIEDWTH
jgi:tetratricopeptide (TPR) repeat protein